MNPTRARCERFRTQRRRWAPREVDSGHCPYLQPALIGAAAISFLMSFENFNTTLMLVGSDAPLTVMMYGRMREGATPVLNAVSLFLMVASALLALTLLRSDRKQPS